MRIDPDKMNSIAYSKEIWGVSMRHFLFVKNLFMRKFNATKAYQDTYPDCTSYLGANVEAHRLISRTDVKECIAKMQGQILSNPKVIA